jgi:hypothetical protein
VSSSSARGGFPAGPTGLAISPPPHQERPALKHVVEGPFDVKVFCSQKSDLLFRDCHRQHRARGVHDPCGSKSVTWSRHSLQSALRQLLGKRSGEMRPEHEAPCGCPRARPHREERPADIHWTETLLSLCVSASRPVSVRHWTGLLSYFSPSAETTAGKAAVGSEHVLHRIEGVLAR